MTEILAKSPGFGGTTLRNHSLHVASAARKIASATGADHELAYLGGLLHDIGKAHPDFQAMLTGKISVRRGIPYRHELGSLFFLPLFERSKWPVLIDMVVAHHRSVKGDNRSQGILDLTEIEGSDEVISKHLGSWEEWSITALYIFKQLGIQTRSISKAEAIEAFMFAVEHCENKKYGWSKWKGLLIGADHLASALEDGTEKNLEMLYNEPDLSAFHSRQNQLFPLSFIDIKDERPHTIVIAPTGAGKTDFLLRRCNRRIFYTLPFQASINAMYLRFREMLPGQAGIRLLHASSKLIPGSSSNQYEEKVLQDKVGASIKVLTPHQIAALICGTRGFETLAVDIAGTDVIMDEIHCYSDISQSMVLHIIRALLRLDCRIHIGSATMPGVLKQHIIHLLGGENQICQVALDDDTLDSFDRHQVNKINSFSESLPSITTAISSSEKILIVCNRVDTAQQRFRMLREMFPEVKILLLHSRYKRSDRAELERILKSEFDLKTGPAIAVSTQVVEVSLDISFDLMVTDCAPLDGLIQRFGRINRRRTLETIQNKLIKPVYIVAPPEKQKDCLPYKKEVLEKSFQVLQNNEIIKEKNLQEMIDQVFTELTPVPIETKLVWEGEDFLLSELRHHPKSALIDMLEIDSLSAILRSDAETYQTATREKQILMEIPVTRSIIYRNIRNYGYAQTGSSPMILDDALYSPEEGLVLFETKDER